MSINIWKKEEKSRKIISPRIMLVLTVLLTALCANFARSTIVDIDCSKNDLPPGSCYNGEPVNYRDGDTLNFIGVTNLDDVMFIKLVATANLSTIPNEIFSKFPNIVHLNLRIGLKALTATTLEKAGKIKSLILKSNHISVLSTGVLSKIPDVEEINLQNNQIATIDDGAFAGLDKLQILNLYGNYLVVLKQSTFSGAVNLRNLNCAFNAIETIEDGALNLSKLEEILFFNNKIKRLPDNIFAGAPKLLNIDFKQNMLEMIGQAFTNLNKLHQLQLSGNEQIADLNVISFASLPSLNYLGLENTGLRSVGSQFNSGQGATKSPLTTLSLSHNQLSSSDILNKLSIFRKLEKLYVDQNSFTRWDDSDVGIIKKNFPHIELVVTKSNSWDKTWLESTLVPSFRANRIYCDQFKYLGNYIFNDNMQADSAVQTVDGNECL